MNEQFNSQYIDCPKCGERFQLTQALTSHIEANLKLKYQEEYDNKIKTLEKKIIDKTEKEVTEKFETDLHDLKNQVSEKDKKIKELNKRELDINKKEREISEKESSINNQVHEQVNKKIAEIEIKLRDDINKENSLQMNDLETQVTELQGKLSDAQQQELDLRKKQRELESEKKEFELTKQRELDAERDEIYKKAKSASESDYKLKLRDKDLKLEQLSKTVDQLNRKLEQGSQQIQGESQELELEDILRHNFPLDEIIPIAKGVKGADIIQKVKNQFGFECGIILWESKRHRKYEPKWIDKLKDDQRNEKAHVAVIISQILPENISDFGLEDGVYIGSFNSALGIAFVLREQLLQIQMLRQSEVGKNQKMESLYNYLTSHEFAHRIEAILEAFEAMKDQVNSERKAFEKQWAAREKMLSQVIKNTSGLHGDLKGLIGASLPEIKALEMPILEDEEILVQVDDNEDLPF